VGGVIPLGSGHEAEVTRRGDDAVVALQHTEHRQTGGLQGAAHLVGMTLGSGLVQDDADDAHRRVVGDHPLHDRGDRAGRVRDVDDQHHRRPGDGRHVRRRGETVAADLTVVETHDALDDRDVGRLGPRRGSAKSSTVQEQRDEPLLADQVRVEVASGSSGGEGVVARVDVVGPDLVARHGAAGPSQRRHESSRDRRLAMAGGGRSDDDAGQAHHSMPR
jgi:hypothetical protein